MLRHLHLLKVFNWPSSRRGLVDTADVSQSAGSVINAPENPLDHLIMAGKINTDHFWRQVAFLASGGAPSTNTQMFLRLQRCWVFFLKFRSQSKIDFFY